jgi:alpha-mannosidase
LPAEAGFGPYGAEWARLIAVVELPACGYRVFYLAHGEAPPVEEEARRIATPPDRFGLSSLKTATGRELLAAPLGLVVVDDPGDTWGHGVGEFRQELGRPALEATEIIADGSIVRLVRQRGRWRSSTILLDLATYQHVDAVELRLRVNWQEPRQMLKLEIPTTLAQVRTVAQVPGGVVERPANGGEEPAQDWVALEGTIGDVTCALGLANAATYSCDCLGGLLRATCLRCAPYAEHDPLKLPPDFPGPFLDQGWQERRFWLVGAEGPYTALGLPRRALEFQTPAEYVLDAAHPGSEPWAQSFLAVSPASVVVLAIKPVEDGGGLIVRLQEMHGQEARAELAIPRLGLTWSETIHPWQIRSLKIETAGRSRVCEVDLLEQPVRNT